MHITYSNAFLLGFFSPIFTFLPLYLLFFVFWPQSLILWSCEIYQSMCVYACTTRKPLTGIYRLTIVMKMGFTWYFSSLCVCVSFFLFSHHSASVSISTREIDIFHFGWRCIYQVHIFPFLYDDSGPRFIDWLFNDFPQLNFDCFNCLPIGFYDVCMRLVWMCVCDVGNT